MISTHAAIDFIVARIVDEAARRDVPLSDIEREVLSFRESSRTPRKMLEVMKTFERDYDEPAFERKIASLLRSAYRATRSTEREQWAAAIRRLQNSDVYLGVMVEQTGLFRAPGDWLRLIAVVSAMFIAVLCFCAAVETFDGDTARDKLGFWFWLTALALGCIYAVARWIFGDVVDRPIDWIIDAVFGGKQDRSGG